MSLPLSLYRHPGAGRDPATFAFPLPKTLGPGLRRDDGQKPAFGEMEPCA